jgi:hypothetical protein
MGLLSLIVLLPLAGFVLNGLGGNRLGNRFVAALGCGLPIVAFLVTAKCFEELAAQGYAPLVETAYTWAVIDGRAFEVSFYFDRLTAVMALIVTGVGSLIHLYSIGYMKEDKSYARYFAYLNLFLFFMLVLVLGRSLLVSSSAGAWGRVLPLIGFGSRIPTRRAQEGRRSSPTASAMQGSCWECSCCTRRSERSRWTGSTPRSCRTRLPRASPA